MPRGFQRIGNLLRGIGAKLFNPLVDKLPNLLGDLVLKTGNLANQLGAPRHFIQKIVDSSLKGISGTAEGIRTFSNLFDQTYAQNEYRKLEPLYNPALQLSDEDTEPWVKVGRPVGEHKAFYSKAIFNVNDASGRRHLDQYMKEHPYASDEARADVNIDYAAGRDEARYHDAHRNPNMVALYNDFIKGKFNDNLAPSNTFGTGVGQAILSEPSPPRASNNDGIFPAELLEKDLANDDVFHHPKRKVKKGQSKKLLPKDYLKIGPTEKQKRAKRNRKARETRIKNEEQRHELGLTQTEKRKADKEKREYNNMIKKRSMYDYYVAI